MEEVLKTLLQSLREMNQRLSDIDSELNDTKSEIKGFEDSYASEIKTIQDSIEFLNVQISETIKAEIVKLPKAKDGADFDPKLLKSMFEAKFKELTKQRKIETTNIKKEIIELVNDIEIPTKEIHIKGKDAEPVDYDKVQADLYLWLDEHKEEIRGEKGKPAIQLKPRDGVDGRSIIDVELTKDHLVITFSDDTETRIKMPKQTKFLGGGGISSEALQDATNELIISTNADLELAAKNQTVLVDATSGDINITLPKPANCFIRGRSNRIAITKIDNSTNTVNIIPFNSEFILSENSQELLLRHEILNFITDGFNWWLSS